MNESTKKRTRWATPEARFDAATERQGDCLIWKGQDNGLGYGQIRVNNRKVTVHRFSYERFVGPIPDGMYLDHICHNKRCVEPSHLRPVTNKQNLENLTGGYQGERDWRSRGDF
jgi:hypothetical protein